MTTSPTEILEQFIADEALHYPNGDQGRFYPSNHHIIKPLVPRAPTLLTQGQRVELYFHLLRVGVYPAIKSANEFDNLLHAYARVMPLLKGGYPICSMGRIGGLFVFGIDDRGTLADAPPPSYEFFLAHLQFWRQANAFAHMPGMLKKQPTFLALSSDAPLLARVTKTLLRIDLVDDLVSKTDLWFWSFMLLALQDKNAGKVVVQWLLQAKYSPADRPFYVENLIRYLQASSRQDLLVQFQSEFDVQMD